MQKLKLAQTLNKMNKTTCFTGYSINDCHAIEESDVGIVMSDSQNDYSSHVSNMVIQDDKDDVMILFECLKLGRTIHDNVRQYTQFQLIVSINLCCFIITDFIWTKRYPMESNAILLFSVMVDIICPFLFSLGLPDGEDNSIIKDTKPLTQQNQMLVTPLMWHNIISSTIYQQIILVLFVMVENLDSENLIWVP